MPTSSSKHPSIAYGYWNQPPLVFQVTGFQISSTCAFGLSKTVSLVFSPCIEIIRLILDCAG